MVSCSLCIPSSVPLVTDPSAQRALANVFDLPSDFFPNIKNLLSDAKDALPPYWESESLNTRVVLPLILCTSFGQILLTSNGLLAGFFLLTKIMEILKNLDLWRTFLSFPGASIRCPFQNTIPPTSRHCAGSCQWGCPGLPWMCLGIFIIFLCILLVRAGSLYLMDNWSTILEDLQWGTSQPFSPPFPHFSYHHFGIWAFFSMDDFLLCHPSPHYLNAASHAVCNFIQELGIKINFEKTMPEPVPVQEI